jgi:hypothetical protein
MESTAAFYKDPFGVVHLKGMVAKSGGTAVIFVLPAGYRPAQTSCLPTVKSAPAPPAAAHICVFTTGEASASGLNGTYLLDSLTFRAG